MVAISRVEVRVNGIKIGQTSGGDEEVARLEALVPPNELEVAAELSGRRLTKETLQAVPVAEMRVEVPLAVFVYVTLVDEESRLEFIFVCGHRHDMPDDAKPFFGLVQWDSGRHHLQSLEPVVLGHKDCLTRLQSLRVVPDFVPGRQFEMVEWEDTSTAEFKACQFQRLLINPVRIGKMWG